VELQEQFKQYIQKLIMDERAAATIQKYTHDICEFLQWYQSKCEENLSKLLVIQWRMMMEEKKNPATVNAAVAAVNGFLRYIGREDCCVRPLKVQRMLYRERRQELTREEYFRLLQTAAHVSEETACMLETICSIIPADFRAALIATARKRGTGEYLADALAAFDEVETEPNMEELWQVYQKKFSYAANLPWHTVMDSIRNLYRLTQV